MIIITFFKKRKVFMYLLYAYTFKAHKENALPKIMNGIILVDAFYDSELEYIILRENAKMMKDFKDYGFEFISKKLIQIFGYGD